MEIDIIRVSFGLQGQTFPAVLNDSTLSGQPAGSGQQVILVSHHPQSTNGAADNGYNVSVFVCICSMLFKIQDSHVLYSNEIQRHHQTGRVHLPREVRLEYFIQAQISNSNKTF